MTSPTAGAKNVEKIFFPCNDPADEETVVPLNGEVLLEEREYLGDRTEIWYCLYNVKGKLRSRWNARFVAGVLYDTRK